MTTIETVKRAINASLYQWAGWEWTQDFDGEVYEGCWPEIARAEGYPEAAVKYAQECQVDADTANRWGERAIALLEEGQLTDAIAALGNAVCLEQAYGDSPTWRPALAEADRLAADLADLGPFQVAPADQGQIVEHAYCATETGPVLRVTDRGDGSVLYYLANWDDVTGEFEPQNGAPNVPDGAWERLG